MMQALDSLAASNGSRMLSDDVRLTNELKTRIYSSRLETVTLKQKPTPREVQKRQNADAFLIDGEIYLKPDRLRQWFPERTTRTKLTCALKELQVLRTERGDTPTCEQLISGIAGKPRYYVIDSNALNDIALPRRSGSREA